MSVREQIMALSIDIDKSWNETLDYGFNQGLYKAAAIAEAREKELQAKHAKEIEDVMSDYGLLCKDFAQLSNDKAALIAELRGLKRYQTNSYEWNEADDGDCYSVNEAKAILAKYEAKP